MHYPVIIIGGGPGGLACATVLAENGIKVLLLERKTVIGPKVCAGGITWSGLINTLPGHLEEKRFPRQHIITRFQRATVSENEPIIATVDRERLGQFMVKIAHEAGAVIQTGCRLISIADDRITYHEEYTGNNSTVSFDHLVGADGAASLVRRHLGLPTELRGVGINYQLTGDLPDMEWHLDSRNFGNGYGWIFPHKETYSIGAYADCATIKAQQLKQGLIRWALKNGHDLRKRKAQAEYINYDYRGWQFGNVFLVGEAAGLASGLTGEGIYPAIVSGRHVASSIAEIKHDTSSFSRLVRMHKHHTRMVKLTGKNMFSSDLIAELVTLGLRSGMLDFRKLEMAH